MELSKKIRKHRLLIIAGSLIVLLFLILIFGYWHKTKISPSTILPSTDHEQEQNFFKASFNPETVNTVETAAPIDLPENFLITDFPFQTQAPFANWDALHEEACEEASLALVAFYLKGQPLSAERMDQEILKLISWENENWGGPMDITVDQVGQMAKKIYSLKYKIINNTTVENLKQEIASGHPVIVPAAGRLLGNPNFRGQGPVYHMVVAIGYDSQNMIVQDVGTRNGNHYQYNQKIFYNAIHDWAGNSDAIAEGAKTAVVLLK